MRFIQLVILSLFLSVTSQAADSKNGLWVGMFGKKAISDNYFLWSETQLRYDSTDSTTGQILFRGGLLRSLNENHEVGVLLGYIQTNQLKEYRPTLQHVYTGLKVASSAISTRSRLEFRDREDNSDLSMRFRFLLRSATPISVQVDFVVWDEPFINLTREGWTGDTTLERNRFFVGIRKKFEALSIETGYLNQFVPRKSGDLTEHLFVLYVNY